MPPSNGLLAAGFSAVVLAVAPMAHSAVLTCQVFEDNNLEMSCPISTTGTLISNFTTIPNFSNVSATGVAIANSATSPNLSVDLFALTPMTFSGTHTLIVDVFQILLNPSSGTTISSTFAVDSTGAASVRPSTLSDFLNGNGTVSDLGSLLVSNRHSGRCLRP